MMILVKGDVTEYEDTHWHIVNTGGKASKDLAILKRFAFSEEVPSLL